MRRVVDHINGDRQNNHYSNLRWATHRENTEYAVGTAVEAAMEGIDIRTISPSLRSFNEAGIIDIMMFSHEGIYRRQGITQHVHGIIRITRIQTHEANIEELDD